VADRRGRGEKVPRRLAARILLRTDQYDPIGGGRAAAEPPGTLDQWRGRMAELIQRL
jgi:hypothetical protein